jgi:trehalose utilization protein
MLEAPNVPVDEALEKIEERGPKLHHGREEGFR